jgi:hypothetical protein
VEIWCKWAPMILYIKKHVFEYPKNQKTNQDVASDVYHKKCKLSIGNDVYFEQILSFCVAYNTIVFLAILHAL